LALPNTDQASEGAGKDKIDLFQASDRCFACHNGLSTSSGEDISIGFSWRPTMMANSADPYWQAGVRRETSTTPRPKRRSKTVFWRHMPMARFSLLRGQEERSSHIRLFDSEDHGSARGTAYRARFVIRFKKQVGNTESWSADLSSQ
jgi:hypothetical protein